MFKTTLQTTMDKYPSFNKWKRTDNSQGLTTISAGSFQKKIIAKIRKKNETLELMPLLLHS